MVARLLGQKLGEQLSAGDLCLDLAWNIDCPTILQWCHDHGVAGAFAADGLAPERRWGQPEDLCGAALLLASGAGAYINGQTLYVDGGFLAVTR